jgi:oligopeptide/dipeptide ABC transporter ATP-binding protein
VKEKILEVKHLKTHFFTAKGVVRAVDDVSFSLEKGQAIGVVGESGSGKSVTALSILRLLPRGAGRIVGGEIFYRGEDLVKKSQKEMRRYRGRKIFMIPQNPMTSLNPVFTIRNQLAEAVRRKESLKGSNLVERMIDILRRVNIRDAAGRLNAYPHEFSGGMRQRVMISMALACQPEILIADEPTTALDVTIQAQVLKLMWEVREKYDMSIILITHDLGVIAKFCDYALVMYAGKILEMADVKVLFKQSRHPYTRGLIHSLPRLGQKQTRLPTIKGQPPDLLNMSEACPFAPRCHYAAEPCTHRFPPMEEIQNRHYVACWKWADVC